MKHKSIILIIVILLAIVLSIAGVTIYFISKSIIQQDLTNTINNETESNNEDYQRIQDNPDEDNLTNVIATPNEDGENSLTNIQATP
ncbi:MAG: hypothetical protein HFJ18_03780 [Clostridia bacterium]|nr:hypothetical protein [Clostridia bacterium]